MGDCGFLTPIVTPYRVTGTSFNFLYGPRGKRFARFFRGSFHPRLIADRVMLSKPSRIFSIANKDAHAPQLATTPRVESEKSVDQ